MNYSPWQKKTEYIWEIDPQYKKKMRVAARLLASEKILQQIESGVVDQLTNVATLPGITGAAWAMPDAHWGYGAPIGSVFATDPKKQGVVSPGAIGFDINCGVRLLASPLEEKKAGNKMEKLIKQLFHVAGAGLGSQGRVVLNQRELEEVISQGAGWVVKKGWGEKEDLEHCEEKGSLAGADSEAISPKAFSRGKKQLGTLGSGNHYLEIQKVEKIFDCQAGKKLGIEKEGQIVVMIHCGSRGLGHQVATDYLLRFQKAVDHYQIKVPDRQLACAPIESKEGKQYLAAMAGAVNFAFANRQLLTHQTREVFNQVFGKKINLKLVYDVAHNMAKWENDLLVHRKGATRAFGPENKELPPDYLSLGQPVIIGGSLETASWLLLGTKKAEKTTFASTCHGAGRVMSRNEAKRRVRGKDLKDQLKERGIFVETASFAGLAEEAGLAYKDVDLVVDTVIKAGVSLPVARMLPLAVIKG